MSVFVWKRLKPITEKHLCLRQKINTEIHCMWTCSTNNAMNVFVCIHAAKTLHFKSLYTYPLISRWHTHTHTHSLIRGLCSSLFPWKPVFERLCNSSLSLFIAGWRTASVKLQVKWECTVAVIASIFCNLFLTLRVNVTLIILCWMWKSWNIFLK